MQSTTVVIVGAGVVGCAVAAEAALHFKEVYLVEGMPRAGMMTSTRNSGVIHSGIYYARRSLKAIHCVRGNRMLGEFCRRHDVPWRPCGKLVVATNDTERRGLEELKIRGEINGVDGLEFVGADEIRRREPRVSANAALWVPSAGIVQTEALVHTLLRVARERGAAFAPGTELLGAERKSGDGGGYRLRTSTGEFDADIVINCAGLYADEVARMFGEPRYRIYPLRGEYARISPRRPDMIRALVYPVPTPISLGVHLTRSVDDVQLIGPSARYVGSKEDYETGLLPLEYFYEHACGLLPDLRLEDLSLAYTGLRPKLVPPDDHSFEGTHAPMPTGDFVVERDSEFPNVIHLIGIESPGLTSCLSLAEHACLLARGKEPEWAAT
jgi:glycerol-3-phosphate dehydrogenase